MSEPEQKWMFLTSSDVIFRWKIRMLVILPKRIICDSECQYPRRRGNWQPRLSLLKQCSSVKLT